MSREPIRNLLGIGMGGHIRALYIVPEVNGALYIAPEVRELLGWGDLSGVRVGGGDLTHSPNILASGGHLWCHIKGYLPAVPFMYKPFLKLMQRNVTV